MKKIAITLLFLLTSKSGFSSENLENVLIADSYEKICNATKDHNSKDSLLPFNSLPWLPLWRKTRIITDPKQFPQDKNLISITKFKDKNRTTDSLKYILKAVLLSNNELLFDKETKDAYIKWNLKEPGLFFQQFSLKRLNSTEQEAVVTNLISRHLKTTKENPNTPYIQTTPFKQLILEDSLNSKTNPGPDTGARLSAERISANKKYFLAVNGPDIKIVTLNNELLCQKTIPGNTTILEALFVTNDQKILSIKKDSIELFSISTDCTNVQNTPSGKFFHKFEHEITAYALNKTRNILAIALTNKKVCLLNLENKQYKTIKARQMIQRLIFNPLQNEELIGIGYEVQSELLRINVKDNSIKLVKLLDTKNLMNLIQISAGRNKASVAYNPAGTDLAVAIGNHICWINTNVKSNEEFKIKNILSDNEECFSDVLFIDNTTLATLQPNLIQSSLESRYIWYSFVSLWNKEQNTPIGTLPMIRNTEKFCLLPKKANTVCSFITRSTENQLLISDYTPPSQEVVTLTEKTKTVFDLATELANKDKSPHTSTTWAPYLKQVKEKILSEKGINTAFIKNSTLSAPMEIE